MILEFENELGDIRSVVSIDRQSAPHVRPLITGEKAPFASFAAFAANGHPPVQVAEPTDEQPLVVSFYCPCWGRYARPYLLQLIELAEQLRAEGTSLLVFSNEPVNSLLLQFPQLNFQVVYDAGFTVARQFGVYSEANPIWDRVSGISEDVFTPALYVIGGERQITYHFLDEDFDKTIPTEAVVDAARRVLVTQ
ncbi:hypothetical protein GCM10023189_24280 [Nibrella saemangeumensis]|uniref:Thioredoxin domain-containing protein n=1 Tax=Nibrella saemangeumensis TaxID=1084526 RepID=A0ABP8MTP2_9BACT